MTYFFVTFYVIGGVGFLDTVGLPDGVVLEAFEFMEEIKSFVLKPLLPLYLMSKDPSFFYLAIILTPLSANLE